MSFRSQDFLVAFSVLWALAAPASGRVLHWRMLDVEARLDAEGALRVSERHTMVFSGAWNGGERVFRLEPDQRLHLERVTRVDPETGERRAVLPGDLYDLDRYDWVDGETLRWRSRLPSDPPFAAKAITYVLEYRLTGVLHPVESDVYLLDHDFAFPDRPGVIEQFRLRLSIDPAFRALDPLPANLERSHLGPGESVVRRARLRYLEEGRPAALPGLWRLTLRTVSFTGAVVAMAWLLVAFFRRERALGRRLTRLPRSPAVDRNWVEERLRSMPPEVAGAVWDWRIGPPEVAALLARWVAEGKLESEMVPREQGWFGPREEMCLRLKANRRTFTGYERDLIDKLFYSGREVVTPSDLRNAYRKTGFDPVSVIRSGLEKQLKRKVPGVRRWTERPSARPVALLATILVTLLALESVARRSSAASIALTLVVLTTLPYFLSRVVAIPSRLRLDRLALWTAGFAVPVCATFLGAWVYTVAPELWPDLTLSAPPGPFGVLALALAPVLVWSGVLHAAMSRTTAVSIAARKELLQVRRYFGAELRKPHPRLDDDWFPYLVALGLAPVVDRWVKAFGVAGGGRDEAVAVRSGAGVASSGVGGAGSSWAAPTTWTVGGFTEWSGAGGRFGGAGASAAWVAAVGSFTLGGTAADSGGGGGGGGGGGFGGGSGGGGGGGAASGGGGGGGW